jgi:formate dehydrogenase major subunit
VGLAKGDTTNELISFVADPNVSIQESKAFTADIRPGRLSSGRGRAAGATLREPLEEGIRRDIFDVGSRPHGSHGLVAGQSQEGEQG